MGIHPKVCAKCSGTKGLQQHHVIYRQHLPDEMVDDEDGMILLCSWCHFNHHGANHRIQLRALRDENFAFAERALGPGYAYEYLKRRYDGDDERLDALLREPA